METVTSYHNKYRMSICLTEVAMKLGIETNLTEFTVDRPFIYTIADKKTGLIIFGQGRKTLNIHYVYDIVEISNIVYYINILCVKLL
jgi:hypothetical protein